MSFLKTITNFLRRKCLGDGSVVTANQNIIGLIAGNGSFPIRFALAARKRGYSVVAVCHKGETDPQIESLVHKVVWIKVGQLGSIIKTFVRHGVKEAIMAGGIKRVKLFGGVKLDVRGAALLARLRSAKDDVIMRGIAEELAKEGVEIVDSTIFMEEDLAPIGTITKLHPTDEQLNDIEVGINAIKAMSSQDIGQMVVVKEGVIVAVEAVEGTDETILRGGKLGGPGTVVVKFAKTTQDMRFDVPTIGLKTIESMVQVKASVLAVEHGRCLIMDKEDVIAAANKNKISIIGCQSLVS